MILETVELDDGTLVKKDWVERYLLFDIRKLHEKDDLFHSVTLLFMKDINRFVRSFLFLFLFLFFCCSIS